MRYTELGRKPNTGDRVRIIPSPKPSCTCYIDGCYLGGGIVQVRIAHGDPSAEDTCNLHNIVKYATTGRVMYVYSTDWEIVTSPDGTGTMYTTSTYSGSYSQVAYDTASHVAYDVRILADIVSTNVRTLRTYAKDTDVEGKRIQSLLAQRASDNPTAQTLHDTLLDIINTYREIRQSEDEILSRMWMYMDAYSICAHISWWRANYDSQS